MRVYWVGSSFCPNLSVEVTRYLVSIKTSEIPRFRKSSHPGVPSLGSLLFGISFVGSPLSGLPDVLGIPEVPLPWAPQFGVRAAPGSPLLGSLFQGSGVPMGPPCPCSQYLQAGRSPLSGATCQGPGGPSYPDTSPQAAECPPARVPPLSALPGPAPPMPAIPPWLRADNAGPVPGTPVPSAGGLRIPAPPPGLCRRPARGPSHKIQPSRSRRAVPRPPGTRLRPLLGEGDGSGLGQPQLAQDCLFHFFQNIVCQIYHLEEKRIKVI